ncbi:LacI family DNA-binding transcriptional regulator [Chloroflexota bacterium]
MPRVTIKDIAKHAGVSTATVSYVINETKYVSPQLTDRVQAAIDQLGYHPNRVARSLRVQNTITIGLVIPDIQNTFFTSLVRAVEDVAYAREYNVILCNSDETINKEALYIDLMLAEQVAGVIISSAHETDNSIHKLIAARIPVVSVDRRISNLDVDTVVINNVNAAFELVSHLIDDGHHRIGAVVAPPIVTTGRERYQGYIQALEAHQFPLLPELVHTGLPKEHFGYQAAQALLDLPDPPTALFLGNAYIALGALKAIQQQGLCIPDEIAVVTFDEMEWTSLVQPGLTVVSQPTYELGKVAAELLFERIAKNDLPTREIILEHTLLIRQSCARHDIKRNSGSVMHAAEIAS